MGARQGVLGVGLVVFVVVTGCGDGADSRFRNAVPTVLREAVALDSTIIQEFPERASGSRGLDPNAVATEGARASGVARVFDYEARRLPMPQERKLKYLRSKLIKLGSAAVVLAEAEARAHAALAPYGIPEGTVLDRFRIIHRLARWEGAARAQYLDALLDAAAAEGATIGTGILPESHAPDFVTGDSVGVSMGWTKDSLSTRVGIASSEVNAMP